MTENERKTCYYCNIEKPSQSVKNYTDKNGNIRVLCGECEAGGKHWGS